MLAATMGRRLLHRIPCQVGVAGGGLDFPVSQKLSYHRQVFAQGQSPRGEGMPQVVKPYVVESRPLPDPVPVVGNVRQPRAGFAARDHPRIARDPGEVRKDPRRRRRQRNHPRARLAVAQADLAQLQRHVLPPQAQHLPAPTTRSASKDGEPPPHEPGSVPRPSTASSAAPRPRNSSSVRNRSGRRVR